MTAFHTNRLKSRYELEEHGHIVFADYQLNGATVVLLHVEAPLALRGSGAAGRLMEQIAREAQRNHQKLKPICSYALVWLQRHKEYHGLIAA